MRGVKYSLGSQAEEILRSLQLSIHDRLAGEFNLVVVTGQKLGLGKNRKVSFEKIIEAANSLGLGLLPNPNEIAAELLYEFDDGNIGKPGEAYHFAMDLVQLPDGTEGILCIGYNPDSRKEKQIELNGCDGNKKKEIWDTSFHQWIFSVKR